MRSRVRLRRPSVFPAMSGMSCCAFKHASAWGGEGWRERRRGEGRGGEAAVGGGGGGGGGGTAQRALALLRTDTQLTHTRARTLLHRVPGSVPLHSPGCQNLAVSYQGKEKTSNQSITKERETRRRTTHTLAPTGFVLKKKNKAKK